jgi:hypothetical protein
VVVSRVTGFKTTWAALLILLAAHLSLNYAAVRAVQMTSLNRQRANIVFSTLLESDPDMDMESLRSGQVPKTKQDTNTTSWKILTPAQVAQKERIFHRDGALQWKTPSQTQDLGTAEIGVSLASFFTSQTPASKVSLQTHLPIPTLTTLFASESYLLYPTPRGTKRHVSILLKSNSTVHTQQKAWTHALLAARVLPSTATTAEIVSVLANTLSFLNTRFSQYTHALSEAGWNTSLPALETRSGRRVTLA